MATYIYDPSEKTTGINPTGSGNGWEEVVGFADTSIDLVTTPIGTKAWVYTFATTTGNRVRWLDGPPVETTDCEILSLWRTSDVNIMQGNNYRVTSTGRCYYGGTRNNNADVRFVGFSGSGDITGTNYATVSHGLTRATNKWYWIKTQVVGTTHRVKFWEYDTTEPADWQIEHTEATTASGRVGFGGYHNAAGTGELAWYSVGTGGDAAPLPGVTAGLQFASNSFLDGGLNRLVNNAERIAILSAYTLADSYAVVTGNILAAATTGTITLSSSGSDRVATSPVVSGTATAAGDADHLAILDDTNSDVLWVTEETSKATIASGNTVNFPALTYTSKQPMAVAIKFASSGVLDGGLNYISANAERIVLLSAYTNGNSYAVVTGNILAAASVTSANFTISSSGTDRQIASDAGILGTGSAAGTATHIAFLNDTGSEVLWVTAEDASLVVAVSDSVSFPALTYTAPQPEAAA